MGQFIANFRTICSALKNLFIHDDWTGAEPYQLLSCSICLHSTALVVFVYLILRQFLMGIIDPDSHNKEAYAYLGQHSRPLWLANLASSTVRPRSCYNATVWSCVITRYHVSNIKVNQWSRTRENAEGPLRHWSQYCGRVWATRWTRLTVLALVFYPEPSFKSGIHAMPCSYRLSLP